MFCVHDDFEALLEGYSDPRSAGAHSPEWTLNLQETLHISHGIIASSTESDFEFVITLSSNQVTKFTASSWYV